MCIRDSCGTLADALAGIDAALHYEFAPVKINVVVVRHLNQNLAQFARLTLDKPLHVRFIEYMPIGKIDDSLPPAINANPLTKTVTSSAFIPWSDHDVVPAVEIRSLLNDALKQEGIDPLVPLKKCSCLLYTSVSNYTARSRSAKNTGIYFGIVYGTALRPPRSC